ncbi:hypothetical protein C1646_782218 [Rhizophagus diaphanus]|nr:hypothetical protein C1646_782218 [Rhizophagus diaphanus] [Rhizophagus sp. MUCL 43196]
MADGRIKDKMARLMIYKEMKPFLPTKITQANLRKKTYRAGKHLILFGKNGIGLNKIKLVSYSATEILKLTNAQIQNVINQVKKYTSDYQSHMTLIKTVFSGNDQIKNKTLYKYSGVTIICTYMKNNFSWPSSMPEYMRRYCFHQITGTGSNIDVQSGHDIIFFYNALERGEFLDHENDWITVYNQEIKAYEKEYSDDELNHIFKEIPGAIQLPVNQKSLPRSKKRKIVTTKRVIDNGCDYKTRVGVRRPEEPELVALINYNLYDRYDNKKYKCVIDTGTPLMIFSFQIKRILGDEGWNLRPIAGSGYGNSVAKIHANKMFEVRFSDKRNWIKWVQAKIADLLISKSFLDNRSKFDGFNLATAEKLGWKVNKPSKFAVKGNSEHISEVLRWYTNVAVTLKDMKRNLIITIIGNYAYIDNGELKLMLWLGITEIRKVKGISNPTKNQFHIKDHGKTYIIPTFSKAPVVKDPLKEKQDQISTNSSNLTDEKDLKKSV